MDRLASNGEDSADIFNYFRSDETYRVFLEDDFDVRTHANDVIQGMAISEHLSKLSDSVNMLDKELHAQVVARHEDLLSQASGIETLQGVLEMMTTRIQSLQAAVDRIRSKITEPYSKILSRTSQLRRLQETCDLLRRIIRILYLSQRLHSQLQGGAREITKAAQSLSELDYLSQGVDLSGIDVIAQDRLFIKQARQDVDRQADKMLEQGIETQNQTQVATALQVFYNLDCLTSRVQKVLTSSRQNLQSEIDNTLDIRTLLQSQTAIRSGPGRAAMPIPGNTAAFRASLWTNVEKLTDRILTIYCQVHHLQRVLLKKRDPISHVLFSEELAKQGVSNILKHFWTFLTESLSTGLYSAADGSTHMKQAFEGEFPKLLRLLNDMWKQLQHFPDPTQDAAITMATSVIDSPMIGQLGGDGDGVLNDASYCPEKMLKQSLQQFQNAYLSRSLSRLFDPINLIFPAGATTVPQKQELDNITKTITSELTLASVDDDLCVLVAKNVSKTLHLFTAKCEQMVSTDGDSCQVIGPLTQSQRRNIAIVNILYTLHQAVYKEVSVMGYLKQEAIDAIRTALQDIVSMMQNTIRPLLSSVSDAITAILHTIHTENYSISAGSENQCSLYMRELQGFIVRVHTDYLSGFDCHEFILECVQPLACRTIELFVRHVSLLRLVGEGGKMKLAADFSQMEIAISPFCRRVSDLGRTYKLLRSFRPILFQTAEHIASSPSLGDIIPYSTILHFLFSRSPLELRSPHEVADWTLVQYSQWLDEHPSEEEILSLIRGTLEAYEQAVKSKGDKEFASTYPVMIQLLQNAAV